MVALEFLKYSLLWTLINVNIITNSGCLLYDANPGRNKALLFYNAGSFFEGCMAIVKQFMKKKLKDLMRCVVSLL